MAHKLEKLTPYLWRRGPNYLHWCQACKCGHVYPTKRVNGPNWSFNDKPDCPSFSPSMRIFTPAGPYGENGKNVPQRTICHYFVTDGEIRYQGDCHQDTEFCGRSFPLEPIPEDYGF